MDIDPRLRAATDAPNHPYDQPQRQLSYPEVTSQSQSYDPQSISTPSSLGAAAATNPYYQNPTPHSYASSNGLPAGNLTGSPYDNAGGQSGDPNDPNNDLKRPRACEACRQLKVRCEQDDDTPGVPCRRCAKAGRQCVVTVPSRKRQKKTDSRVAELEKKIDALTASLHAQKGQSASDVVDPAIAQAQSSGYDHERVQMYGEDNAAPANNSRWVPEHSSANASPTAARASGSKRKHSAEHGPSYTGDQAVSGELPGSRGLMSGMPTISQMYNSTAKPAEQDHLYTDVIDRRILTANEAYLMFDRFTTEMSQQVPIIVFHPLVTAEEIRRTKPLLFLSVITVACGTIRADLATTLNAECVRVFADRVICRGEKTLELVQAILAYSLWYAPPDRYEELKFYMLIHIALTLAVDVGMGKRAKSGSMWNQYAAQKSMMADPDLAETRRTWLGCYWMCSNAAMSLRRPPMVRWSKYMDESIEVLENAPDALATDKVLCCWAKAQQIAEEIGDQFHMDDPKQEVSINNKRVTQQIAAFRERLAEWREQSKDVSTYTLRHCDATIDLYMHEVAMHKDHNIDDFKPPYGIDAMKEEDQADHATPAHIEHLDSCMKATHDIFDAFLAMDLDTVRALPTIIFVRTSYAAVGMIKMYISFSNPLSKLSKVFDKADLKVEYYMDRLVQSLQTAGDGDKCRSAAKFGQIIAMLRTWFQKKQEEDQKGVKGPTWHGMLKGPNGPFNLGREKVKLLSEQEPVPQTGLQMLSEVAMGNPGAQQQQQQQQQQSRPQQGNDAWQYPPVNPMVHGMMNTGFDLDQLGLGPEDWNIMNQMMDEGFFNMPSMEGGNVSAPGQMPMFQ